MNRQKALDFIKVCNKDSVIGKTKNGVVIRFARQSQKDIDDIEKMSAKTLVKDWKGLVWLNYIYGQVSLNDMERISLLEMEMETRKSIKKSVLHKWYSSAEKEFNKKLKKDLMKSSVQEYLTKRRTHMK